MADDDDALNVLRVGQLAGGGPGGPEKALSIQRDARGGLSVYAPPEVVEAIRRQRAREHTVATVPSAPRTLIREAGGQAWSKPTNLYPHATLQTLRDVRDRSPLLAPIHRSRYAKVQRVAVPWQRGKPGIRVVHKNHTKWNVTTPEGFQPWIDRFSEVLWTPSRTYGVPTLGVAVGQLMEDLLTINRPVIEPLHALYDPKRIVQWRPVDGAIVWPTLVWTEKWASEHPGWLDGYDRGRLSALDRMAIMSEQMKHNLDGAEYVLVRDGIVERTYRRNDLIVSPQYTRTDIRRVGYPPSHVEEALKVILAFFDAYDYNHSFLTKGMMTEIILGIPADLHDDDATAFFDMLREATQGVSRAWQPPAIPIPRGSDGIQVIDLKKNPTDSGWDSFMSLNASLCTAIYRTHVSSLGIGKWDGGGGDKLGNVNESSEINLANEEGLVVDMGHICSMLTELAQRCHPDLRVIFESGINPKEQAELYTEETKVATTRNEVRIEQGRRPQGAYLDDDEYEAASPDERKSHDDNPWNWPTDPGFASAMNQIASRAMMQQQQGQPGAPAGQDDGFGGQDDGFGGSMGGSTTPYGTPQDQDQGQGQPPAPNQPPAPAPLNKAVEYTVHVRDREYP